mmetsp:Transcript_25212/g.65822  ORF Transcript_25212/g.65822 Transcript_25212/m.65822 type:complete len:104 (-) Transcript_25212:6146-6457(-)
MGAVEAVPSFVDEPEDEVTVRPTVAGGARLGCDLQSLVAVEAIGVRPAAVASVEALSEGTHRKIRAATDQVEAKQDLRQRVASQMEASHQGMDRFHCFPRVRR